MPDTFEERAVMLAHLDAAKFFLETAGPLDCAVELVVQGLDIVAPELRLAVIVRAVRELGDDAF